MAMVNGDGSEREDILGICGAFLLIVGAFSPCVSIGVDLPMGMSATTNLNPGMAVLAAVALALLLCRHRWTLVFPAGYAILEVLSILYAWAASAPPRTPMPPRALTLPFKPLAAPPFTTPTMSPDWGIAILAVGAVISLVACWSDLRTKMSILFGGEPLPSTEQPASAAAPEARIFGRI